MATTPKTTIGTMACMCCGHQIPVKKAANGTINAACSWCDFPAWAKAGTQAHKIITERMTPTAQAPAPEPAPAPAKRPAATPTPAATQAPAPRKTNLFGL